EMGRSPTSEEVAKYLQLPEEKLAIIQKAIRVYNSTPQPYQSESGWSIDELLIDTRGPSPETSMFEAEDLHPILKLLDSLDPREAAVLRMRFGLDGEEPQTLKEIGKRLNVTRERVRQIQRHALRKLSEQLHGEKTPRASRCGHRGTLAAVN